MSSLDVAVKDYPNEAERDAYSAFLSNPMQFPPEFKTWLSDWLAVNIPYIPVAQLQGYKDTTAQISIANARMNMSGSDRNWLSSTDGLGPSLTNLNPGVYFVCYGYQEPGQNAGSSAVHVGISVNGATPTRYMLSTHLDLGWSNWEAIVIDLTKTGIALNSLEMKYWYDNNAGADAEFQYRWLMALRVT